MTDVENTTEDNIPLRTQAEITGGYKETDGHVTPLALSIGYTALNQLKGLAILDDSSIAAQIRRSIDEYYAGRVVDPTMPRQVEAARQRSAQGRPESEARAVIRSRQEAADDRISSSNTLQYLERASVHRKLIERGEASARQVTAQVDLVDVSRLDTIARVFPGSTMGDHINAAILMYTDGLMRDPQFIAQVEEGRRVLEAVQYPAR